MWVDEPGAIPFRCRDDELRRRQEFLCLLTKPDERAQHRWPTVPAASIPPLPHVRWIGGPAVPCVALIYLYAFQAAVLKRDAPSTTYPIDLVVSRETCSGPLHWYSVDTVRTPLYRPHGHPQAPMRKRRTRNPSEENEQPATRLGAKHRLSAHANRRTREFCSSHRSVYGIPSSYSSLAERPVPPPGRGLSIPFPHANMIPGALA